MWALGVLPEGVVEAAPEPVIVWCFWTALTLAPMARATSSSVHDAPTPASAKKVASQTEVVETRQRLGLRLIERPGFGQFEFKVEVATGVPLCWHPSSVPNQ